MSAAAERNRRVAIACGGTGGHLFPGLAVAEELLGRGCFVTLLISPKDVDQQALTGVSGFEVVVLPAVGLVRGHSLDFLRGFRDSYRSARAEFQARPPQAALAMGGFTSAPPILAGKRCGARAFLHESNAVPGRANRWLSWVVDGAFVGFPSAAARLHTSRVMATGTPVRRRFTAGDAAVCRAALGLNPARPVILVAGGSQGATGINDLVARALPLVSQAAPDWQWLHLSGANDCDSLRRAYAAAGLMAVVLPFCQQMERALGAATVAVCRAGASSLAELAALRVPAILIPYPYATDNHQYHNARVLEQKGAAVLMAQPETTAQTLLHSLQNMVQSPQRLDEMRQALAALQKPQAAREIAETVLRAIDRKQGQVEPAGGSGRSASGQQGCPGDGSPESRKKLCEAETASAVAGA